VRVKSVMPWLEVMPMLSPCSLLDVSALLASAPGGAASITLTTCVAARGRDLRVDERRVSEVVDGRSTGYLRLGRNRTSSVLRRCDLLDRVGPRTGGRSPATHT